MGDGHGLSDDTSGPSSGYDIGPDEDRYDPTQFTPIDIVVDGDDSHRGEVRRAFVMSRPDGMFEEPLDETPDNLLITETVQTSGHVISNSFFSEVKRLQTFNGNWQDNYCVRPTDLARNGFIYCGPKDKVKCVFCLNSLWGWEPGDSIQGEHQRYYPECPFVRGQCEHLNVPLNPSEIATEFLGLQMKTREHQFRTSVPSMQNYTERYNTYQMWPVHVPVSPLTLAEAGLFYLGTEDKVKCFSCGKVLSHWEEGDEPWTEHAKWSPDCQHVLSLKGSEFVHQAVKTMTDVQPQEPVPARIPDTWTDENLRIPVVQAIMETYDISVEQMRQKLEQIMLTRGPDYSVTRNDFEDLMQ